MKLKKWDEIREGIHADKWWYLGAVCMAIIGIWAGHVFPIVLAAMVLVSGIIFSSFSFDASAKRNKTIVISIILYGAGVASLTYGLLRYFIPTLPQGVYDEVSIYILVGVLVILLCLYDDFIKPKKKSEEKKNG